MNGAARRLALPAFAVIAVMVSSCGGGDDGGGGVPDPAAEDAPGADPAAGIAPPAGRTTRRDPLRSAVPERARLTITVDETGSSSFRYRAPSAVRGGLVEIRLRNLGDAPRKAQLWRITGDHSLQEALRIRTPLPPWLQRAGGVSLTAPKATSRTLQSLPAGRYYVAATLDEPGDVAAFQVTGTGAGPEAPRAPARVESRDFSFRVSGLKAGRNTVEFDNTGTQPHHAFFVPMEDGADLAAVKGFFASRTSTGPPPVDPEGTRETVVLEGGERQVTELDLPAGRYALICFVRGRGGGQRHLELGMINEVTVK